MGTLYFVNREQGIFSWNPDRNDYGTLRFSEKLGTSNFGAGNLHIGKDGVVWVKKGSRAVDRFDPQTGTVKRFTQGTHADSLAPGILNQISEDQRGNTWFAFFGGGISRFDAENEKFIQFRHLPEDSTTIGSDNIQFIYHAPSEPNHIWVASNRGLTKLNIHTGIAQNFFSEQLGDVHALFEDYQVQV